MRRWLVVLVACIAVAVGVPTVWFATRPAANAGVSSSPAPAASAQPWRGRTGEPGAVHPGGAGRAADTDRPPGHAWSGGGGPRTRAAAVPSVGVDAAVTPVGVDGSGAWSLPKRGQRGGLVQVRLGARAPRRRRGDRGARRHPDSRARGRCSPAGRRRRRPGRRHPRRRARRWRTASSARRRSSSSGCRPSSLFARDGAPRLVLITCGGPFVPELASYRDNLVVVAVPVAGRR